MYVCIIKDINRSIDEHGLIQIELNLYIIVSYKYRILSTKTRPGWPKIVLFTSV